MRRPELAGPLLVALLTVVAVGAWSYVFVSNDDRPAVAGGLAAATASAGPSSAGGAGDPGAVDVLVVGDSWTDPRSQPAGSFLTVAGEQLGWDVRVVADGSGTGYLSAGDAAAGTFADRLAEEAADPDVDLVVLQGGASDAPVLFSDANAALGDAVQETLDLVDERYAGAEALVLGPVATTPAGPVLREVDRTLGQVSQADGAAFVSPLRRGWLTGAVRAVDEATGLPNAQGRQRLAERFADAVSGLSLS